MTSTNNSIVDDFVNNINQDSIFNETVSLMRSSCETVLGRIKNNLDATVAEKSEGTTNQFVDNVTNQLSSQTNSWIVQNSNQLMVVPEGTRFVHRDSNNVTVLIEHKPSVRTIRFNAALRGGSLQSYQISLPYIQYFITFVHENGNDRFRAMSITCSKTSVQTLNDVVYQLPLPNVNSSGSVCIGNMGTGTTSGTNIVEKINTIISGFWNSNFNYDLSDSMIEFWNSNFHVPENNSLYWHRMGEWAKKTAEDSLFSLKATYHECGQVSRFIRSDIASATGRAALANNMRQSIQSNTRTYVRQLTTDLNTVNILEENRNQPHVATLKSKILDIARRSYYEMWHRVHNTHEQKVIDDNRKLDLKKREIESIVNNSAAIIKRTEAAKASLQNETMAVKTELYKMYQYLQKQIEEVNELKSKLSSHVDSDGNVLEKKKRGRPRVERVPEQVNLAIDRVVGSNLVTNPDGSPIVRRRGRPRKSPVVSNS
jgi:hypothetical protein